MQKCYIKLDLIVIYRNVESKPYINCYNQSKKRFNCTYYRLCIKLIIAQKIHSKLKKKLLNLLFNSIKILMFIFDNLNRKL